VCRSLVLVPREHYKFNVPVTVLVQWKDFARGTRVCSPQRLAGVRHSHKGETQNCSLSV
jgi:hypothetical protein